MNVREEDYIRGPSRASEDEDVMARRLEERALRLEHVVNEHRNRQNGVHGRNLPSATLAALEDAASRARQCRASERETELAEDDLMQIFALLKASAQLAL